MFLIFGELSLRANQVLGFYLFCGGLPETNFLFGDINMIAFLTPYSSIIQIK